MRDDAQATCDCEFDTAYRSIAQSKRVGIGMDESRLPLAQGTGRRLLYRVRKIAFVALLVLLVIGLIQAQRIKPETRSGSNSTRMTALNQASSLLMSTSNATESTSRPSLPLVETLDTTPGFAGPSSSRSVLLPSELPLAAAGVTPMGTDGDKSQAGVRQSIAHVLRPVSAETQVTSHTPPVDAGAATSTSFSSPRAHAPRREIPLAIEGIANPKAMGDALDGITIRSSLRVLEGDTAPFELLATRFDGDRPRVKMRSHRLKGAVPVSMGWMEVGDSPASGWHVVAISPADTVLLSPLGNPLRLRLVPGDGPAGHPGTAGSGLPLEEHDGP